MVHFGPLFFGQHGSLLLDEILARQAKFYFVCTYIYLMLHFVYILYSFSRNLFYVGITTDLEKRLNAHNSALSNFTKSGIPWKILWQTVKHSKSEAETLERKIKNYARFKKIKFIKKHSSGIVDHNLLDQIL